MNPTLFNLSYQDLPNPRIDPESPVAPALQADSFPLHHLASPKIVTCYLLMILKKTKDKSESACDGNGLASGRWDAGVKLRREDG